MRRCPLLSLIFLAALAMAQPPIAGVPPGGDPTSRPGYSPDVNRDDPRLGQTDENRFFREAFLTGMTAVELGKVAVAKASNDAVKQFAQKMMDAHLKLNEDLKQLARRQNIGVPESLDPKHQSRVDKISKLSGADFDRAYIKDQLKDHQLDVREFQLEAKSGSDPDVKSFASKTIPLLEEHLSTLKDLDKGKKTTASK
jgi:putative membrane protein